MENSINADENGKEGCYQVVIIGAGISGLSAARHLRKHGIDNILILEATGKAGGRIDTAQFGKGLVEVGAQWVHGEQNEFCQLVKASNHRHEKTSWEGKGDFLCPSGIKIENGMVDEVLGWVEDTIEEVEATFSIETLEDGKGKKENASIGQYLLQNFQTHLTANTNDNDNHKMQTALFQWEMSFQRIDNSCSKMNDVSLYRWSEFEVNPGEHYNNFREGAQSFVNEILVGRTLENGVPPHIRYNSQVKTIHWNVDPKVPVEIETRSGAKYLAETVLVTCSIGVLKSNLESLFTPCLPENLALAIKSTGYGPVTKIFLEWENPWWPADFKGFQLVWPDEYIDCCGSNNEDNENIYKIWHKAITGFDPVLENPNVLLAWLGGPEAVYAEGLTKEAVTSRCVQILKDFTGLNVTQPKDVLVSKWNTHEFFQGAYSFRSVDGDKIPGDICAVLCEPISVKDADGKDKPVIVFAGEALSKNHYSTLHGAYESGMSQAQKIIQYLTSSISVPNSSKDKGDILNQDANHYNISQNNFTRKLSHDKCLPEELFQKLSKVSVNDIKVPS